MANKTKLDVINNIMVRLREQQVTSSEATAYSTLISSFVVESYEEVLDEWNWRRVAEASYIEVPAGVGFIVPDGSNTKFGSVIDANIVSAREHGEAFSWTRKELYVDFDQFFGSLEPGVPIKELALPDWQTLRTERPQPLSPHPATHYTLRPLPNDTMEIFLYPKSSIPYTLQIAHYHRPDRFDNTVSTDATTFDIPFRPVQELALMYALNERGEELGEPGNLAQGRYVQALAAAKELDLKAGEHSNALDWERR